MSAKLIIRDKEYEVKAGITARRALEEIGVPRESVLITRQGALITEDEVLKEGEVIKLISVISGGKGESQLHQCPSCGQPTTTPDKCTFCRMFKNSA